MSLNGSLVGVTSHTTPLPAGEGLGEGPAPHGLETVRKYVLLNLWVLWEKRLPRIRERNPLRERKRRYESVSVSVSWWYKSFSTRMKNIYKTQQGRPLFTIEILARRKNITHMISVSYGYEKRRGLSCIKKGMFLYQERHVLGCWRAFPWALKGMDRMGEGRK